MEKVKSKPKEKKKENRISYMDAIHLNSIVSSLKNIKEFSTNSFVNFLSFVDRLAEVSKERDRILAALMKSYGIEKTVTRSMVSRDGKIVPTELWPYENHESSAEIKTKVDEINNKEVSITPSCFLTKSEFQILVRDMDFSIISFLKRYLLEE